MRAWGGRRQQWALAGGGGVSAPVSGNAWNEGGPNDRGLLRFGSVRREQADLKMQIL